MIIGQQSFDTSAPWQAATELGILAFVALVLAILYGMYLWFYKLPALKAKDEREAKIQERKAEAEEKFLAKMSDAVESMATNYGTISGSISSVKTEVSQMRASLETLNEQHINPTADNKFETVGVKAQNREIMKEQEKMKRAAKILINCLENECNPIEMKNAAMKASLILQ